VLPTRTIDKQQRPRSQTPLEMAHPHLFILHHLNLLLLSREAKLAEDDLIAGQGGFIHVEEGNSLSEMASNIS